LLGCFEDSLDAEIAIRGRGGAQGDDEVGLTGMEGVAVRFGTNGSGLEP